MAVIAWLANMLGEHGLGLEPGHIVMTGALHAAVPLAAGDRFVAEFDRLGEVSVTVRATDSGCSQEREVSAHAPQQWAPAAESEGRLGDALMGEAPRGLDGERRHPLATCSNPLGEIDE